MIKSTKTPILPNCQVPNCIFWYNCKFHHSKIEITQLAYFHFLIDFSMQKLPFFKASYHVTFQCGSYSTFKSFIAHENIKKWPQASKVAYLWQFWFFFLLSLQSWLPKTAQIGKSYHICVSSRICSLICARVPPSPLIPTPLKSYLGRDSIRVITLFELGLIRPKSDSLGQRSCLEKHR